VTGVLKTVIYRTTTKQGEVSQCRHLRTDVRGNITVDTRKGIATDTPNGLSYTGQTKAIREKTRGTIPTRLDQ
jgi:hypothetical protein